jgi:transposase
MDEIGILPRFKGVLCHDHWKPYYRYDFSHVLCNAHHLRELTRVWEQDKQIWAKEMEQLLRAINIAVDEAGGVLSREEAEAYRLVSKSIGKGADGVPAPRKTAGQTLTRPAHRR